MSRLKKNVTFDATDDAIIEYFDQAMALKDSQRAASAEITSLNSLMQEAGVDPGTLSTCCRLAKMPPGKRGISVALLDRYLKVLASKLEDPTMPKTEAPETEERPFVGRATAA